MRHDNITLRLQDLHWYPWVPEGKFIHEADGEGASVVEGDVYVVLHRNDAGEIWVAYSNQPVRVWLVAPDDEGRWLEVCGRRL